MKKHGLLKITRNKTQIYPNSNLKKFMSLITTTMDLRKMVIHRQMEQINSRFQMILRAMKKILEMIK